MFWDGENHLDEVVSIVPTGSDAVPNLVLDALNSRAQRNALFQFRCLPDVFDHALLAVPPIKAVLDRRQLLFRSLPIHVLHEGLHRTGPVGSEYPDFIC
jgi:hypothetical protein